MTDIFEQKLSEVTQKLEECQRSHGFIKSYDGVEYMSCMECEQLIGCMVRREYVDAVYASMSKGATGGFEF